MNRNKMILGAWVLGLLFPIEMMAKTSCTDTITESFFTPDRVKVQVYAKMVDRAGQTYPEFRLVKIKEDNEM